jgi:hypothetical protein
MGMIIGRSRTPLKSSKTLRAVRRRETVRRSDENSPLNVQNVRADSCVSRLGDQPVEESNCADTGGTLGRGATAKRFSPMLPIVLTIAFFVMTRPVARPAPPTGASPLEP